jgi:HK97 family phage major capsid protein
MSELSRKADFALAELTDNGGVLNPAQNDTFIRLLIDQPTMLRVCRTVPMNTPEMKLNKIGFGERILRVAPQGESPYAADDGSNDRYLLANQRSKPTTSQIRLTTEEVIAEVRIPYEVLEDNIERGGMADTVLALIAERAALDLEELLLLGDTAVAGSDPYLGLMNGILKRVTSNVVDAEDADISPEIFNDLKKALPTRYRRNLGAMRFISSMDRESDYRLHVAGRETGLGDSILTSNANLPVLGVPLQSAALMPNQNLLFSDPQNFIFGVQRNVRIEQDRDIRSREIVIVLTARIGIQIEQEDAVAKVINLGPAAEVEAPGEGGGGGE